MGGVSEMGYMRHHVILVTGHDEKLVKKMRARSIGITAALTGSRRYRRPTAPPSGQALPGKKE